MKKVAAYFIFIMISFAIIYWIVPNDLITIKTVLSVLLAILATVTFLLFYKSTNISRNRIIIAIPFIAFTIIYAIYCFNKI